MREDVALGSLARQSVPRLVFCRSMQARLPSGNRRAAEFSRSAFVGQPGLAFTRAVAYGCGMKLNWVEQQISGVRYWEAVTPVATFTLMLEPTNNIRGPWRLLIARVNEFVPEHARHYHDLENAKEEAALINEAVMKVEA